MVLVGDRIYLVQDNFLLGVTIRSLIWDSGLFEDLDSLASAEVFLVWRQGLILIDAWLLHEGKGSPFYKRLFFGGLKKKNTGFAFISFLLSFGTDGKLDKIPVDEGMQNLPIQGFIFLIRDFSLNRVPTIQDYDNLSHMNVNRP